MIATLRGEIETQALVTDRLRPFHLIDGRRIYQIGMPWHFGWKGYATGDIANVLTAVVGDPNTSIHENKALTCNLRRGTPPRAKSRTGTEGRQEDDRLSIPVHPRALDYPDASSRSRSRMNRN